MRQSLVQLGEEDGHIISDAIARQERDNTSFLSTLLIVGILTLRTVP
jgi:hypothetical protein